MTAATSDIDTKRQDGIRRSRGVAADQELFAGTMVCVKASDGYVYDGADTAGYLLAGVVQEYLDTTGDSDGDENVDLIDEGEFLFTIAAAAITDVGKAVYLKDNATVAFLSGVTNKVYVGRIVGVYSSTQVWVRVVPMARLVEDLASVASGLGASLIGIQDAGSHFTGADVEAALAELKTVMQTPAATEVTIAGGAITMTQAVHSVDTESDGATDDLDTITAAKPGFYILVPESDARVVTIKHNTGNIICPGEQDIELTPIADGGTVFYHDGTNAFMFDTRGLWTALGTPNVNGAGAAMVGIEDADTQFTGVNVEAALDELGEMRTHFARGEIATGDVQTMNATPVEVIAAPSAGAYIEVVRCHWWLDHGGVDYDAAAAGDTLNLKYTDGSGDAVVDAVAGDVIGGASADYHTLVRAVAELIPVAAAAIVAHIATGEWYTAAGNSPLKYEIEYRIKTLAFATP